MDVFLGRLAMSAIVAAMIIIFSVMIIILLGHPYMLIRVLTYIGIIGIVYFIFEEFNLWPY